VHPPLTTDQLIELYKTAIEEYRFQVRLNNDRLLHFTVFNIAVLSAGVGLMKVDGSRAGNALVAAIFIAGFFTSLIGALAVRTFHQYYRRTVHRKTVYEELLGLTLTRELPDGNHADLAIGTTNSQVERHKILTQTEEWVAGHANVRMTEEYTVVQLKRQDELTRRIQDKLAKAKKRLDGRNIVEIKTKTTAA
jgi:hypothetical protein